MYTTIPQQMNNVHYDTPINNVHYDTTTNK